VTVADPKPIRVNRGTRKRDAIVAGHQKFSAGVKEGNTYDDKRSFEFSGATPDFK
jgi:hypothetical protein